METLTVSRKFSIGYYEISLSVSKPTYLLALFLWMTNFTSLYSIRIFYLNFKAFVNV